MFFVCFAFVCCSLCADEKHDARAAAKGEAAAKTRFVHSPRASVRCGPGQQFYATMVLERGAAVDVFIETPDGWSAIRPPEGSHDWVPADALYLLPGGNLAEVSADRIAAWIGAHQADEKTLLYQTELVKSQTVTILGEANREEGGQSKLWFRIAPPPGEFRWMRTSQLGIDPITPSHGDVQLAGFTAAPPNASSDVVVDSEGTLAEGDVVWSDESEQIAKIEREIRAEQTQIERQTHSSDGSVMQSSGKSKKQSISAHEKDQSYWNAMQGTSGSSLKVGPMNGILGWLGFSIVEDGAMVDPQGPRSSPANGTIPSRGALSSIFSRVGSGSLAASNLDHLPRPSRRYSDSTGLEASSGSLLAQGSSPPFPMEGALNTLLRSRGPLFGDDSNSILGAGATSMNAPDPNPIENQVVVPRMMAPIATTAPSMFEMPEGSGVAMANYRGLPSRTGIVDPSEIPERFQTPAIQDAMIQLSAMVSKPTEQWNLEPFRVSAKSWIELGDSPLVRGESRLLMDRIEQFESLRRRTLSPHSSPMPTVPPLTEAVPQRTAESGSDASGWMVSVHTSMPGQPEFALTDDAGNVIAYVRPTTGLNLRRFLQQPVTVYGMPGYIPNLAAKQIIAERVVRLR